MLKEFSFILNVIAVSCMNISLHWFVEIVDNKYLKIFKCNMKSDYAANR